MRFHVVLFHVMPPYLSTIATCHSITTISLSQELTIFTYYSSSILVPPYDITWVNVSRFKWTGYQIDLAIVTGRFKWTCVWTVVILARISHTAHSCPLYAAVLLVGWWSFTSYLPFFLIWKHLSFMGLTHFFSLLSLITLSI